MRQPVLTVFRQRMFGAAIAGLALSWLIAPGPTLASASNGGFTGLCEAAASRQERQSRIPRHLLRAIAAVESGRWDASTRANIAWPWTVTAKGTGRFLPSKDAAIRAVRALQREGVTNIDVGCMQINLGYHPEAFGNLDEAFEPAKNVAYAARFLTELRKTRRSWSSAVRFYHSSDPARQRYYGRKVNVAQRAIRVAVRQRGLAAAPPSSTPRIAGSAQSTALAWPARGYRAQRRMELAARARAFNSRRRPR